MKSCVYSLLALALVACAAPTRQTDAFLHERRGIPDRVEIPNVPFLAQTEDHCGPATLAEAMRWAGSEISIDELSHQVYTPSSRGTFQSDLIGASRRHGLMAVPIHGLSALLQELADGHPVLIFENLAFTWYPRWHYALAVGIDLAKPDVTYLSGGDAYHHWDMRRFERSWVYADYWGLVVLPAGGLARSAGELANTEAAAGLEQAGKLVEARRAYLRIHEQWPESLGALIGLGNLAYGEKQYRQSFDYLTEATRKHPESADARHNLAVVQDTLRLTQP